MELGCIKSLAAIFAFEKQPIKGTVMIGEDVLIEIDTTLDRLIENAAAIENVELDHLSEVEIEAFQKTQESLLQHLLHMDRFLESKRKTLKLQDKRSASYKIQEKRVQFEKMRSTYSQSLCEKSRKAPILSKRKNKRFLKLF